MSQIKLLIAKHLEVPQEFIIEINERPNTKDVVALLVDYRKFTITESQLAYAQQQLENQDEPDDETAVPQLTDLIGLGKTSADRLNQAGITTVQQLRQRTPEIIAEITKAKPEIVKNWFE